MAGTPPCSFAQGEQPEFIVSVADREQRTEMIVKFSLPTTTPVGWRATYRRVAVTLAARSDSSCTPNTIAPAGRAVFYRTHSRRCFNRPVFVKHAAESQGFSKPSHASRLPAIGSTRHLNALYRSDSSRTTQGVWRLTPQLERDVGAV